MKRHIILLVLISIITSFLVSFTHKDSAYGRSTDIGNIYLNHAVLDQVETFESISFLVPSGWNKRESLLFTTYYPNEGDSTKFEIRQGLSPEKLNISDTTNKEEIGAYLEETLHFFDAHLSEYKLYDTHISAVDNSYSIFFNFSSEESDGYVYETMQRIYFTQQHVYFMTFTQPVRISKILRTAFSEICDSVQIKDETLGDAHSKCAQSFITAFRAAGFPVRDEVIYDEMTDPNVLLGRPGEYIEKVDFSHGDTKDFTIEIFKSEADAQDRQEYFSFLKQYVYLNGAYMLRMPYAVPPETAARYEKAFAQIIAGETVDDVSDYFSEAVPPAEDDLDVYADNITYQLFPLLNGEAAIVFTNHNDIVVPSFEAAIVFYDDEGDMLATSSDVHRAVLPGSKVVTNTINIADPHIDFKNYSVQIKVDTDTNDYECLSEQLSVKSNEALDGGVIAEIKNNADKEIEELEVAILFYVDEVVIAAGEEEKYDILPGETEILKFRVPYDDYDRIKYDRYELFINQAHHISF